jgi:signal transduction histidine kinase
MKIRNKLTYLFIGIVASLIFVLSVMIYVFSANFRKEDFYSRLENRATSTARLLVDVDEIDAALLKIIEKSTPGSLPEEKIVIYDYTGEIVFSTDIKNELWITRGMIDEIRLGERKKFRQGKCEVLGLHFSGKYDRFIVFSAAIDINGIRKLKNLRLIIAIGLLSSVLLTSLLGWIYSGRAIAPISRVIDQVSQITESNLNKRLETDNGRDEIAQLSATFNDMLDRLETSFRIQKNFIANASHELRTPLTSITGQLEVVQIQERTPEEYQKTIESVLEDCRNLNRTSNRLLLLAQTSEMGSEINLQSARVDDLVWQARAELLKRNSSYMINVEMDPALTDENYLLIDCNEQLLKTALINLIENGCKYSSDQRVQISMLPPDNNELPVYFTDNGIGIDESDLPHIFQPFYRSKNALMVKGHGIGLSLVERIVKLHKGTIHVESLIGKGTTFKLRLPLSRQF